jgi:hypothetical protein
MISPSAPPGIRGPTDRFIWWIVAALLVLYFFMAFSASWQKGVTFDEIDHLATGYNYWLNHDFRLSPANGDFVKRWASLPLLISRPKYPSISNPLWRQAEWFNMAYMFFFQSGNDPATLLLQGRAMVALLGVALGFAVFLGARELFGNGGGLIALVLFVFCPHMLAHGAMVTTDMSTALMLFVSTWSIWRLLHHVTWGWLVISLLSLGFLFLCKMTSIVIVPIAAMLVVVRLIAGPPLVWTLGPKRVIKGRGGQAGIIAGLVLTHALVALAIVWAGYDFRYAASADASDPGLVFVQRENSATPLGPYVQTAMDWCRRWHVLPEGYLKGNEELLTTTDRRPSFMDGHWKVGGWHTFFLYAFWIKTPPALLLLLPLGLAGWWRFERQQRKKGEDSSFLASSFYQATPFVISFLVYYAVAIAEKINIGHRHILFLYPVLYVLAGSAILWWPMQKLWAKVGVVVLIGWFAVDSVLIRPHYLAYFNGFSGGPAQGYRHLVDSSLDWGQDLPGLKHWLAVHNPGDRDPVFLSYFGTDSPDYYGINSMRLPGFPDWRERQAFAYVPGYYVISATMFQNIYTQTFGPWNRRDEDEYQKTLQSFEPLGSTPDDPEAITAVFQNYPEKYWHEPYDKLEKLRFARLCGWLRATKRPPDDNVGYSILIWKLDEHDLHEALAGPPLELYDAPAISSPDGI